MTQDEILKLINEKGEMTSKEISENLFLSKTSVWKELNDLVKKKLITKIKIRRTTSIFKINI